MARIHKLQAGMMPSSTGLRCEILFNPAQPGNLTIGGAWSYGSNMKYPQVSAKGATLGAFATGTSAKAKCAVRCEALNTSNFTVIGAFERAASGNLFLISQRGGGHGVNISGSGANVVQWGVRDNFINNGSIGGVCVAAVTKRPSDNLISLYINGTLYGTAAGTGTVSSTAIAAGIGTLAGTGVHTSGASVAGNFQIYGVAVLPGADNTLCASLKSVEDFYNTFFVLPHPRKPFGC